MQEIGICITRTGHIGHISDPLIISLSLRLVIGGTRSILSQLKNEEVKSVFEVVVNAEILKGFGMEIDEG